MTSCCSTSNSSPAKTKRYTCPINGQLYNGVSTTTMLHHINQPWEWQHKDQGYYFCDDSDCDVVYFGEDDSIILKSSLRLEVSLEKNNNTALICFFFGVSKEASQFKKVKDFVIKCTKEKTCACSIRNPSGRCCLKDFN
jgi:hypothetical protein